MKRFLSNFLVLCFLMFGFNTMAFAQDSASTQTTSSTDTQNTDIVDNMQATDTSKTTNTTQSAWEDETPMKYATSNASACSVGDKIYYIGGYSSNEPCNYTQIYDTKAKTWSLGTPLNTPMADHSVIAYKNKIYAIGGIKSDLGESNSLQIYDTDTNTWTNGATMIYPARFFTPVLLEDKIYLIGGRIQNYLAEKVQIYDIKNNKWSLGTTVPIKANGTIACTDGKKIYIIGECNITSGNINVYDTTSDTWSTKQTKMLSSYIGLAQSTTINNKVYIACYESTGRNKAAICYDMSTDTWDTLPDVNLPRAAASIASVGNKIYVLGGVTDGEIDTPTVESLTVSDDSTTPQLSVLLNQGESVKLSVTSNLSDNTKYTWSSSDETVATVDANGVVTAVNPGKTSIYAENTESKFKESIPVVVVEGTADKTRLAVNLDLNQSKKLYLNDDTKNITWSSNDNSKVSVSDSGEITGKAKGLAIINATYNNETYKIYVRVTNA